MWWRCDSTGDRRVLSVWIMLLRRRSYCFILFTATSRCHGTVYPNWHPSMHPFPLWFASGYLHWLTIAIIALWCHFDCTSCHLQKFSLVSKNWFLRDFSIGQFFVTSPTKLNAKTHQEVFCLPPVFVCLIFPGFNRGRNTHETWCLYNGLSTLRIYMAD